MSRTASYAEGLFNYIDTDGDGSVSYKDISEEIKSFRASRTPGSKLRGNAPFSYYYTSTIQNYGLLRSSCSVICNSCDTISI